ncbi:unnamed protein product [Lymnaea stagnalis]|uniref:Uncharacterized protein n=1 Tax=Lymnaea stagnalis TaxID=6523 RepID=A0AAV2HG36_LYMST
MDFIRALEQAKTYNLSTEQFIQIWQTEQQGCRDNGNMCAQIQSIQGVLVSHLQALHNETMLLRQEIQHTNGRLEDMFKELVTLRTVTAEETKNNLELMKIYAQQEVRLQLDQQEVRSQLDKQEIRPQPDQQQQQVMAQLDQQQVTSQLDQRQVRPRLDQQQVMSQLDQQQVTSQRDQQTTPNGYHEWDNGYNRENDLPVSESWADITGREHLTPSDFPADIASIWSPHGAQLGTQNWEQEIRLQQSEWREVRANKTTEDDDLQWQETKKKSKKQVKEQPGITIRSDFQGLLPPASEPVPTNPVNGIPSTGIFIQEVYSNAKNIPQGRSYLDGVRCRKLERSSSSLNLTEDILGFPDRGSISKINNARKFFSTKQEIKTDYVSDMRNKACRIRLRLWVKDNSLQVQVLVSESANGGAQQKWPIMLMGSGHLFNPRTRKHAELWSLHCKCAKPPKGGDVALNTTVNLSGNCPLVTFDVLESKFYVEDNSLKFLWELSAYNIASGN